MEKLKANFKINSMHKLFYLLFCTSFIVAQSEYKYKIDLAAIQNDKVQITLTPPTFTETEVEFCFPAMVPGTYEVYDFGRFISSLSVTGKNNASIKITKVDVNTYKLSPAASIENIIYTVDDTWDKTDLPGTSKKIVFEPGGTNFELGVNFSLNTHSMFGYFKNYKNNTFELEFTKPLGFYPSTGLTDIKIGKSKDVIKVLGYNDLVDSPIMYCIPDTTSINVANTQVLISCYSPNKKVTSGFIARTLTQLLDAQRDYLGGELPVKKYAFLFYYTDKLTLSGSNGALEHSYSSFYVMPEMDSLEIQQELRDVAAHEFFHIVTPLNIHATQIGDFDFNNPKMSEHLWLYEGMTEYAAHHAQAKGGIITIDQLIDVMMRKYDQSLTAYNDTMSFTWMSRNVLLDKVHNQYSNVYEKGAVIGMCLDILLRDLSNGDYGTQNLMKDLATKYGKNKSFNDADLFDDIEKFTFPKIGTFLRTYVGGKTPLPMQEILEKIGINFVKESVSDEFTLGGMDIGFNPTTNRLMVLSTDNLDAFGKSLKLKTGDELASLNGNALAMDKVRTIFTNYYDTVKEGDVVTMEVYRPKGNKGKMKLKKLSAKAQKVKVTRKNQIEVNKNMSAKQKQTLKTWIGYN